MQRNPAILGFFFFQAEDGIRDIGVTGVQTCALPILRAHNTFFIAKVGGESVTCILFPKEFNDI